MKKREITVIQDCKKLLNCENTRGIDKAHLVEITLSCMFTNTDEILKYAGEQPKPEKMKRCNSVLQSFLAKIDISLEDIIGHIASATPAKPASPRNSG